jgi:hypothetical protein
LILSAATKTVKENTNGGIHSLNGSNGGIHSEIGVASLFASAVSAEKKKKAFAVEL